LKLFLESKFAVSYKLLIDSEVVLYNIGVIFSSFFLMCFAILILFCELLCLNLLALVWVPSPFFGLGRLLGEYELGNSNIDEN
jgi:hypothetical protein